MIETTEAFNAGYFLGYYGTALLLIGLNIWWIVVLTKYINRRINNKKDKIKEKQ